MWILDFLYTKRGQKHEQIMSVATNGLICVSLMLHKFKSIIGLKHLNRHLRNIYVYIPSIHVFHVALNLQSKTQHGSLNYNREINQCWNIWRWPFACKFLAVVFHSRNSNYKNCMFEPWWFIFNEGFKRFTFIYLLATYEPEENILNFGHPQAPTFEAK